MVAAAWFFALCNRGINMVDEGVQVLYGYEVASGMITYRDYFVPVAPLGFLIQAGLIKLFGFHLIVSRIYAALQGVIVVAAALRLGRRNLQNPFSLVPAIMLIPFSVALGSFPHYNLDAAFFALLCLVFLDAYLERPGRWGIFWAALFGALAIASKHSMVLVAVPLIAAALLLSRYRERPRRMAPELLWACIGFLLPLSILGARYAHAHALEEAAACLGGVSAMKRVLIYVILPRAGALLLGGVILVRVLLYLSRRRNALSFLVWPAAAVGSGFLLWLVPWAFSAPLVTGVAAVSLALFVRPDEGADAGRWFLMRAFALLLFLATALSGVDLGHLLLASAGSVLPLGLLLQNLARSGRSDRVAYLTAGAATVAALLLGIWLDLAVPHLAYTQGPRWKDTSAIDLPGLELMRTSPEQARELERTVGWLKAHTGSGEKIFVYPWDLLLYVFAERMPATYDTFLYYEIFDQRILVRVLEDLEANRPRVAVVRMDGDKIRHVALAPQAKAVESYLRGNYNEAARFGDYMVMTRKR